jgi:N-acetylmuramoyl-L-alanine amidase
MKSFLLKLFLAQLLFLIHFFSQAQVSKEEAQRRFRYLNFHSSLDNLVSIDDNGIKLFPSATAKREGKAEFSLSWNEARIFSRMLNELPTDSLVKIYEKKGKLIDPTLQKNKNEKKPGAEKKLEGIRIALDPGHIAGDFETGKVEQKFLEFRANDTTGLKEEVKITEGILTWQTAMILKDQLEKQGAKVFVTRKEQDFTSFGMSYDDWLSTRKKTVLDSLKTALKITAAEHKKFMRADKEKFFWDFFRDHELANRIRIINEFNPDITAIIHYNVDEKNTDWLKPGTKNYSMCFIGGGMTADNFKRTAHKINFLRLLLTDDYPESEKLSGLVVQEFSKQLDIPIATKKDATYLDENCNASGTDGVFCRNLALCRAITSPLVYGECLYQDNIEECQRLSKCDKEVCGIKTNSRVQQVANCYATAILKYFIR